MIFADYSPPESPSLDVQRDALQKGLGRSSQWAVSGCLSQGVLLDACLNDKRYDMQCEDNRGDWLWGLMNSAGLVESFREPLLESLRSCSEARNAYQLCDLIYQYAVTGDDDCESALYAFVESRQVIDAPWVGEGQLLDLGGFDAFKIIARIRGASLSEREWDWDDDAIIDRARESFDAHLVEEFLSTSTDSAVLRFGEMWNETTSGRSENGGGSYTERMKSTTLEEVIKASSSLEKCYWLRGWGMHAEVSDLKAVFDLLCSSEQSSEKAKLLRVFSNREIPEFDSRMIELCSDHDEEVRRWAFNALAMNSHPSIREFALGLLKQGTCESVVSLFERNFSEGDENCILDALQLSEEPFERHGLLLDVIKVLEANSEANCEQLGVVAYFETPCQNCRFYAARLLHGVNVSPDWLVEEAHLDSEEDIRKLFVQPEGSGLA